MLIAAGALGSDVAGQTAAPADLSATVAPGGVVTLTWSPQNAPGVVFILEAGSASGLTNLAVVSLSSAPVTFSSVPVGTYFVRVRAQSPVGLSAPSNEVVVTVASSGLPGPRSPFEPFDAAIQSFMTARGIPAGTLAIGVGHRILHQQGFGWKNQALTEPIPADALLRLASITKPVTAAAIRQLAGAGLLSLADRVICTGGNPPCHLTIVPLGSPDPRLGAITIAQLLDHTGGWDREVAGDPMFRSEEIAAAHGVSSPPSKTQIASWVFGRPLDFSPGQRYAYSNFGYMLLGLIIERLGGLTYAEHVQRYIFQPLGVPPSEVVQSRTLLAFQNPREPYYSNPGLLRSVYPPYGLVPVPYGSFDMEVLDAHGGLSASATAIARFLGAYWISGIPRAGNGQSWLFYGSLPGTSTLARQLPNGVNIVVLFNQRLDPSGQLFDLEALRHHLDALAMSTDWSGMS